MPHSSIFYDPKQKRAGHLGRVLKVFGVLATALVALFFVSVLVTPALPRMPGVTGRLQSQVHPALPKLPTKSKSLAKKLYEDSREALLAHIIKTEQADDRKQALSKAKPPARVGTVVAAFYGPWQATGMSSLKAHAGAITHLMPQWLHLTPDGGGLDFRDFDLTVNPHNQDVLKIAAAHGIAIVPVLDNNTLSDEFDPSLAHLLLADVAKQDKIAKQLLAWLSQNGFAGVNIDLENLTAADYPHLPGFLKKLRTQLAPAGMMVSIDVEATNALLSWPQTAAASDLVILMAYDEHSASDPPGPIASLGWYETVLERAHKEIPADKLIIGLGNYAYDWQDDVASGDNLSYQEAIFLAKDNHRGEPPETIVDFDDKMDNPTFNYNDEQGNEHEVWMLDGVTAANQWVLGQQAGARGAALWVLGQEDPSLWKFFDKALLSKSMEMDNLLELEFPYDVEFVGDGEILQLMTQPQKGLRSIETDPKTGLAVDEEYHTFPASVLLRKRGMVKGALALTIDDGPDPDWTPRILDELKALKVPATFFMIGQNVEQNPDLVQRVWDEGHEIGNHSYTHPNLADASDVRIKLELNATQRAIQSVLGRSTLLFRPPYNADAEPATAEEVRPIAIAADLGYLMVGEFIDPQDWNLNGPFDPDLAPPVAGGHRTAVDITNEVMKQVHEGQGNTILLHDAGGNRAETVKALAAFVPALQKQGYKFVTVSALLGSTRDSVMPPVSGQDALLRGTDRVVFEVTYYVSTFLRIAFVTAIFLGVGRVAIIIFLALIAWVIERRRKHDDSFRPAVSVLIAAYNEDKVIERTIRTVLDSGYTPLEVIVVDDGSKDETAQVVADAFLNEPRVRLIKQPNGGKAAALNNAISQAKHDILVCLDADTQFAKDTIPKLVRHFKNPKVAAVAGNVKVGNRINLWTQWQSIEYITAQNVDRRAFGMLNAITVVPGAIGAWRREVVLECGGYTTDTLAEDMDLTWRIRRKGWRIENETKALAFTEAPDTAGALLKQRFRWAYGTLQCLWKHKTALGRYGFFGLIALPTLWIFQMFYQILSPLVDLQILWTVVRIAWTWITRGLVTREFMPLPGEIDQLYRLAYMYAVFFVVELVGATVACLLDREKLRPLWSLFWQRFVYRQLMYVVVLRSIKTAILGIRASWSKLERKGTVGQA